MSKRIVNAKLVHENGKLVHDNIDGYLTSLGKTWILVFEEKINEDFLDGAVEEVKKHVKNQFLSLKLEKPLLSRSMPDMNHFYLSIIGAVDERGITYTYICDGKPKVEDAVTASCS